MSSLKQNSSKARKWNGSSIQHVVPQDGGWAVRGTNRERATSIHSTQAEAIEAARRVAKNQHSEVVIHGRDGRIRHKISESPADKLMFQVWEETHKDRAKSKRA